MHLSIQEITHSGDLRINFFRELKGNAPRIQAGGLILIEGEQQVERFLRTELRPTVFFMERRFYERFLPLLTPEKLAHSPNLFTATRQVMAEIIGYRLHQGVMVLAERPAPYPPAELPPPVIALNGLNDPENVGSIVRTAVCLGMRSFLIDKHSSDPYLRRSIRVSMGGAFAIQVSYTEDLAATLQELKPGSRIVGVEQTRDSEPVGEFLPAAGDVYVFGNEKSGLSPEVLAACDRCVEIPLAKTPVHSLNVGAAAAVVLYRVASIRGGREQ